ncbi:MAG: hypothetical protein GC191_06320 [Azospirillum sp.]|nr:hypothetical protein [Azospirillum sp.]
MTGTGPVRTALSGAIQVLALIGASALVGCATPDATSLKAGMTDDACGSVSGEYLRTGDAFGIASRHIAGAAADPLSWELRLANGASPTVLSALLAELQNENALVEQIQQTYDRVTACRRQEVIELKADAAAKRISRAVAELRLALIRERYENDVRIARLIGQIVSLRNARFRAANELVNPGSAARLPGLAAPHPTTTVAPPRQPPHRPASRPMPRSAVAELRQEILTQTASNQSKRNDFVASIARAEAWRDTGFVLD